METRLELHIFRAQEVSEIPRTLWQSCEAIICFDIELRCCRNRSKQSTAVKLSGLGLGFDNIDLAAAAAHGIPVSNTPDYGTTDVADHAIALVLALTRGITAYNDILRKDGAAGWDFLRAPTVRRVAGRVFGVVGLGRIGTATALRAKALGMDVMFLILIGRPGPSLDSACGESTTSELLTQADFSAFMHRSLTKPIA